MTSSTWNGSFLPNGPQGQWDFDTLNFGGLQPVKPGYNIPGNTFNMMDNLTQDKPGFLSGMDGLDMAKLGIGGMQTLSSMYFGHQANKLAKDQLNFAKTMGNANLNNSIKSYNTQLGDRARSAAVSTGQTPEQVAAYIAANQLAR